MEFLGLWLFLGIEVSLDSMFQLWHQSSLSRLLRENNYSTHLVGRLLPQPGWPHFSSSPSLLHSIFCAFRPCFFSFFLESFSLARDPAFSHRVVLKAGSLFPARGKLAGRRRQADFLTANLGSMSVWEKKSRRDGSEDDRVTVSSRECLQWENCRFCCFFSQTHLNNFTLEKMNQHCP